MQDPSFSYDLHLGANLISFPSDGSVNYLNISDNLYLTDENYKNTIETHDNLTASGSNL